jgi:ribosomal protein S18 acetylase RimI-like enzyme
MTHGRFPGTSSRVKGGSWGTQGGIGETPMDQETGIALTLRPARAEDEAAVVALWRACGLVVSWNDPVADFRRALGRGNSDILIAADPAGKIVGAAMIGHDGHRGWIYYLAADPDRRRQGIGRKLVAAAQTWLKERGIAKLQLMIRDTNTEVVRFYERIGFEIAPRVIMQKWL